MDPTGFYRIKLKKVAPRCTASAPKIHYEKVFTFGDRKATVEYFQQPVLLHRPQKF